MLPAAPLIVKITEPRVGPVKLQTAVASIFVVPALMVPLMAGPGFVAPSAVQATVYKTAGPVFMKTKREIKPLAVETNGCHSWIALAVHTQNVALTANGSLDRWAAPTAVPGPVPGVTVLLSEMVRPVPNEVVPLAVYD